MEALKPWHQSLARGECSAVRFSDHLPASVGLSLGHLELILHVKFNSIFSCFSAVQQLRGLFKAMFCSMMCCVVIEKSVKVEEGMKSTSTYEYRLSIDRRCDALYCSKSRLCCNGADWCGWRPTCGRAVTAPAKYISTL